MTDRYSTRHGQRSSWFVPTVVVVGIAAFFLWESGWRPFEVIDVPTGTVNNESEAPTAPTDVDPPGFTIDDGLPDITAQQFEPDNDMLSPDELLVHFDPDKPKIEAKTAEVRQAGFETDTVGQLDSSDFSDMATDIVGTIQPKPPESDPGFDIDFGPEPAAAPAPKPTPTITAELQAKLNKIDFLLEENDYLTAHRDLSTIYWYEPHFREIIKQRIERTSASIYAAPQPHYMKPYLVQSGDTLEKIAKKYKVPWTYFARLNRVQPGRLRAGSKLKVIRGPFHAVVDLSDFELTVHAHGYFVRNYKIGIGAGQSTPIGEFKVSSKLENPNYYAPEGGVVDGDDPSNPLGEFWLGIGDGYGIHGTINPGSIGKAESKGCIRLSETDIAEVFDLLTEGSTVKIRR